MSEQQRNAFECQQQRYRDDDGQSRVGGNTQSAVSMKRAIRVGMHRLDENREEQQAYAEKYEQNGPGRSGMDTTMHRSHN